MVRFTLCAVAALFFTSPATVAQDVVPITLEPITHAAAQLVVVTPDGAEISYTPEELERLPTYQLTTTTPWRETPARFEGVLLSDVLAFNGLDATASIRVTAENDFSTAFSRLLWESVPILVATRVNGAPHTRRQRGPIQFVFPAMAFASSDLTSEAHYVWMAARIEPGA